jgi:hypothetical protein
VTPFIGAVADASDAAREVYALIGSGALTEAQRELDFNSGGAGSYSPSILEWGGSAIPEPEAGKASAREIVQAGSRDAETAFALPRDEIRQADKGAHHRWWSWHSRRKNHSATAAAAADRNMLPSNLDGTAAPPYNGTGGGGGQMLPGKAVPTVKGKSQTHQRRSLLLGPLNVGAQAAVFTGSSLNDLIKPATDLLPPELATQEIDPGQVRLPSPGVRGGQEAGDSFSARLRMCQSSRPGALFCVATFSITRHQRRRNLRGFKPSAATRNAPRAGAARGGFTLIVTCDAPLTIALSTIMIVGCFLCYLAGSRVRSYPPARYLMQHLLCTHRPA